MTHVAHPVSFLRMFARLGAAPVAGSHRTLRAFVRQDAYALYGADAAEVSMRLYGTLAEVKLAVPATVSTGSDAPAAAADRAPSLHYLPLREAAFRDALHSLLRAGFGVEVWQSSGAEAWEPVATCSPGNARDLAHLLLTAPGADADAYDVSSALAGVSMAWVGRGAAARLIAGVAVLSVLRAEAYVWQGEFTPATEAAAAGAHMTRDVVLAQVFTHAIAQRAVQRVLAVLSQLNVREIAVCADADASLQVPARTGRPAASEELDTAQTCATLQLLRDTIRASQDAATGLPWLHAAAPRTCSASDGADALRTMLTADRLAGDMTVRESGSEFVTTAGQWHASRAAVRQLTSRSALRPLDAATDADRLPLACAALAAARAHIKRPRSSTDFPGEVIGSFSPSSRAQPGVRIRADAPVDDAEWTVHEFRASSVMLMSESTRMALQIMLPSASRKSSVCESLCQLLDRCCTPMGRRLLREWLLQPSCDVTELERRYDMVSHLLAHTALRRACAACLRGAVDVHVLATKMEHDTRAAGSSNAKLRVTLRDVFAAYKFTTMCRSLAEAFQDDADAGMPALTQALAAVNAHLNRFRELVEHAVDIDLLLQRKLLHVRPSLHPELQHLRLEWDSNDAALQAAFAQFADALASHGIERERIHLERYNPVFGPHVRVPSSQRAAVLRAGGHDARHVEPAARAGKKRPRGSTSTAAGEPMALEAILELGARADGYHFTCPSVQTASRALVAAQQAYRQEQRAVEAELIRVACTYAPALALAAGLIAHMDVLLSYAEVIASAGGPFTRPILHESDGELQLQALRHPLVEASLSAGAFVPNDVCMRREEGIESSGPRLVLVTGPNMGGKSTYTRSVALAAVLAQVGMFVPAESAQLPIFDSLHARIGAGDDPAAGASSFMAEMSQTAAIVRDASPRALVIIDELGRGTSTHEGFGIAMAVARHLTQQPPVGCLTLFATHFHELARLALECNRTHTSAPGTVLQPPAAPVFNVHMSASVSGAAATSSAAPPPTAASPAPGISLTFRVCVGVCGASLGLRVAALAGLPRTVLDDAEACLARLEQGTLEEE